MFYSRIKNQINTRGLWPRYWWKNNKSLLGCDTKLNEGDWTHESSNALTTMARCSALGEKWVIRRELLLLLFCFISTTVTNYNKKEKTQQEDLGNPKLKLRTKVRGGNASEDAGPLARGTDATKPGSPLKVISNVYWVTRTQTPKQG
jgi:hypothetical protein